MSKAVGVVMDGDVTWHIPGCSGADYATLCGLDGNDPAIGQTGVVQARRGQKVDCPECKTVWERLTAMRIRKSDFE